jgi:hypothetical protein
MDSAQKTMDATAKLVGILTDLDSQQRRRAVSAALVLLGESAQAPAEPREEPQLASVNGLSPKALAWAKKNAVSTDQLEHVFAIDSDGVDVIAARAPGRSKRLQTIESYVLCGLRSFLASGELSFRDDDARETCKKLGAFDSPNHFNYVKALGNLVGGSKDGGWKLTNPGLVRAAEIVKQLSPRKGD